MSEPGDVKISEPVTNPKDWTSVITLSISDLHKITEQQVKIYVKQLLQEATKQAVMSQFPTIATMVDEAIHSDETKEMIKRMIEGEIKAIVKASVEGMFNRL